jgi:hypothetical protein
VTAGLPIYRQTADRLLFQPSMELPVVAPIPSSRDVYDPSIGADGGGRPGDESLPAIDPDAPVEHVDELAAPVERTDPAMALLGVPGPVGRHELATGPAAPVCCPTCGTAVHPDRLR